MTYRAKPFTEVFWRNVDRRGPNECWPWLRSTQHSGHGQLSRRINGRKHSARAHRIAWELTNGPIPDGQLVCHRCDNPPCCNPAHLFLGTHDDNMADCKDKGRNVSPRLTRSAHPRAVLSEGDVVEIRRQRSDGALLREIAASFGIGTSHVSRICRGLNWTDVEVRQ